MPTLDTKVAKLINQQIGNELYSHLAYLSMAAFFEGMALKGFAHWMRVQAQEEHTHAMKFFDYLLERGAHVAIPQIPAPKVLAKSPADIFALALRQEQGVTQNIYDIYAAATAAKDYATLEMLNWFLKEQVEEEASASEILDRVKMAGNDSAALLQLDIRAGKRSAE
jgi:ferritin